MIRKWGNAQRWYAKVLNLLEQDRRREINLLLGLGEPVDGAL
jgi:hypothetical protein